MLFLCRFKNLISFLYFINSDEKAKGDHNESVLASYLETSINSQAEQPQICQLSLILNILFINL
jgi:hypothetical protein